MALTGTAAATSGTGLVVTLDGSPSLAGVLTDGSHVVWVNTTSGRQFAAITAKDDTAKTVTTTTAYTINLTGQTWAIGGKRATLDNANTRKLFTTPDLGVSWSVDIQEAGSAYALTSAIAIGAATSLTISSSTTNRPTITSSASGVNLFTTGNCPGLSFRHLQFTHTGATRGRAIYPLAAVGVGHAVLDCVFDGMLTAIDGSNAVGNNYSDLLVDSCEFKNGTATQLYNSSASPVVTNINNCFFHDNAGAGIGNAQWLAVADTVFARNTYAISSGINASSVVGCVVQGGTSGGLLLSAAGNGYSFDFRGNVLYGNTGNAVTGPASATLAGTDRNNAFGGNGTNRTSLAISGPAATDVTLTADPFTNAAGNDFTLNSTAGGGALLKGVINNVSAPGLVGTAHGDVGPFQSAASGAAGLARTPTMTILGA